jgi:ELWxxDGT repeat protein
MNALINLRRVFLIFSIVITFLSQSHGQILPLADLNTTDKSSYPNGFIEFNGYTYFMSKVGLHRVNSAGVTETIDSGDIVGNHYYASKATNKFLYIFNSEVYYFKRNNANFEVWKTDGVNKQLILSDIPFDFNNTHLYYVNNNLCYFVGGKLYRIENNSSVLLGTFPDNLHIENSNFNPVTLAGIIIFYTFNNGLNVWKSDGTVAGTILIGNINNFAFSQIEIGAVSSYSNRSVVLNNETYIFVPKTVNYSSYSLELWKTDGQSLTMVKEISPNSGGYANIYNLTEKNGKILFNYGEYQFWVSDGTATGTINVKTFNSGIPIEYSKRKWGYLNGYYYFGASENSTHGLWKSDGTVIGTTKAYDNLSPEYFFETNSNLYFVANRTELWRTDGTSSGTAQIPNYPIDNETPNSGIHLLIYPEIFKNSANQLLLKGWDVQNGYELWKSNSTIENSTLLSNLATKTNSSLASDVKCKINGIWFFNGVNDKGAELWKTDGTPAGTQMVTDLNVGAKNTIISAMTSMQGILYFIASGADERTHVYRSDGTATGTYEISTGVIQDEIVSDGSKIYFIANSDTGSYVGNSIPWVSDGTVQGTRPIPFSLSNQGITPQFACKLTIANNKIFFVERYRIWTGNSNFINPIYNLPSTGKPYLPISLIEFNQKIYMIASVNNSYSDALFETDGTEAGTKIVKEFPSDYVSNSSNFYFEKTNNKLYFRELNYENINNRKINLWCSDGTNAGTIKLRELGTDYIVGSLRSRTIDNQLILFIDSYAPSDSIRAWSTDGTVNGTNLIFKQKATPNGVVSIGKNQNKIFFSCYDQNRFFEIWQTDGTAFGTFRIGQNQQYQPPMQPSFFPISPKYNNILDFNQRLVFWTHDNLTDYEPWYYQLDDCQNNTNYTLKSGNWNDASCWSCGFVPTINQLVVIKNSHTITLSVNENVSVKRIKTEIGGILKFETGALVNLND